LAGAHLCAGRSAHVIRQRGDVAQGEAPCRIAARGDRAGGAGGGSGRSGGDPYQGLLRAVPTELARVLKEELGYGDTERISVYRHRGRTFQLLGRYSENPQFDRRTTRLYPDHQGVVAKAWEDRTAAELSLPDPEGDEASYYQTLEEKWSMDEETTRQLTMRSRALVGCAIYEPKGVDREAVVIVESARVGTITREEVVRAMEGEAGSRIYEFLEREESNEPDPNYAKEQDY
jgi:hypothetical protein